MAQTLDILSWACILAGGFFCITGGIGLHRLPDCYCRAHAAGLTDTLGAGLILTGLMLQALEAAQGLVAAKLVLILVFLFLTSPTSTYALVRAAFRHGLKPRVEGGFDERLMEGERPGGGGPSA